MSRVGKLPIKIPSNVNIFIQGRIIKFTSGEIEKSYITMPSVSPSYSEGFVKLTSIDSRNCGVDRSNIYNIISGIISDFLVTLEINGVGYKASVQNNCIIFNLGYSHEIFYYLPNNVLATLEKPNLIKLTSNDKITVGQVASEIISFRPPEPYKGKGIKILGKPTIKKEGKKK